MSVAPVLRRPAAATLPPWVLAALLAALWLAIAPPTPDLAAQVYRAGLFAHEGFAVWDNNWFAGHHLPGYSLVFPPLGALLGTRVVGMGAAVTSTLLFGRMARAHFGKRAHLGMLWFAVAAMTDLWVGRITYGLGVAVGLYALAGLAAFLIPTPMGSNVTRLGMEFSGPLLACAAWQGPGAGSWGLVPARRKALLAVAGVALFGWQWSSPVHEVIKGV